MTNYTEHKKLFIKMMLSIVAFSVLILSAVLIPASYAKWQAGSSTVTGTVTTGTWTIGYDLTYDINGHGKKPDSFKNVTQLTEENLPVLTAEGFTFEGWYYSNGTKAEVGDMLKDHLSSINKTTVTLQAKWTEEQTGPKPGDENLGAGVTTNGVLVEGDKAYPGEGMRPDITYTTTVKVPAGKTFAVYHRGNLVAPGAEKVSIGVSDITYLGNGVFRNNSEKEITISVECSQAMAINIRNA
ncbi:MAG: InlB B-repeat-containing protein [Clostridia bacterium]|nr:InlB B-repeat-containing protein [Clostridia bacterium]